MHFINFEYIHCCFGDVHWESIRWVMAKEGGRMRADFNLWAKKHCRQRVINDKKGWWFGLSTNLYTPVIDREVKSERKGHKTSKSTTFVVESGNR